MAKKNQGAQQAPQQSPLSITPPCVDFDAWWAMNEKKIPAHHYKEIIKADFEARGLSSSETIQTYNDALGKYGLKLK